MTKTHSGEHASCKYCMQDIEFQGKLLGWADRGNNRGCVAFFDRKEGEIVRPTTKHAPYREKNHV